MNLTLPSSIDGTDGLPFPSLLTLDQLVPSHCERTQLHHNLHSLIVSIHFTAPNFTDCLPNCGVCTPHQEPDYVFFNLIISGVVLPLLGVFGLMGNALSAFVYSRPECRSSTNLYLCALGFSDSAVILTAIFLFGVESYRKFSVFIYTVHGSVSPIVYPMGHAAQVCSVYFTLVAGMDCFVVTCLSNRIRNIVCRTRTVKRLVMCVVIFSICYNVPHCFESIVIECYHEKFNSPTFELCPDPFRFNEMYSYYYYKLMYSTFVAVGPLLCLILMNISIIGVSIFGSKGGNMGDTIALVLVVLLFIVCNTIALVLNVFEDELSDHLGIYFNYMVDMSNVLVVFNSSFNFVIYVIFSGQFRRTLLLYICGGREPLREITTSTSGNLNSNGSVVAPAPPIIQVITEKSRLRLANDAYGNFLQSTQREVLI
ncbi:frpr-17 [Pristionchus pacificus]|nr:frpr-17 [Pristionchus pacificus]